MPFHIVKNYWLNEITYSGANKMLTCPVEPVPLELLPVIPLEHLVDADDVSSVVRGGSLLSWVHWRPGDGGNLENHQS